METQRTVEPATQKNSDRIEKRVTLRAPRSRVWRAIASADEFSKWFGVSLEGSFAEGQAIRGKISYRGQQLTLEMFVERIQPETLFSYRWHPYAIDPKVDFSSEPTTLVEFRLEDSSDGTLLTIVETGFDRIPLARRAEAFRMNDQGWTSQAAAIEKYVTKS